MNQRQTINRNGSAGDNNNARACLRPVNEYITVFIIPPRGRHADLSCQPLDRDTWLLLALNDRLLPFDPLRLCELNLTPCIQHTKRNKDDRLPLVTITTNNSRGNYKEEYTRTSQWKTKRNINKLLWISDINKMGAYQ